MCIPVQVSRRDAALAGLGALLLLPVGSAQAGLLGGPDKNEVYTADTVSFPCSISLSSCRVPVQHYRPKTTLINVLFFSELAVGKG